MSCARLLAAAAALLLATPSGAADWPGYEKLTREQVLAALAGASPAAVRGKLCEWKETSVLLVGHGPTLSRLVQLLCAGRAAGGFIELKKAGCACLDIADPASSRPHAVLRWLATVGEAR